MSPPRKIPTKAELLRLQRQFKTDARIAERLGNVKPHLVGYWRRKRNVPNYSAPKFAEKEILTLWERFGNDDRCGAELGISKAAFYSWRRRYNIKARPAFLKLEQMEFQFPGEVAARAVSSNTGKRPATHKLIFANRADKKQSSGPQYTVTPDLIVIDDPGSQSICSYISENSKPVFPVERIAFYLTDGQARSVNGDISARLPDGAALDWLKKRQIRHVHCPVDGSMWNSLADSGAVLPGQMVLCQRGHERFAGALGALGWWRPDSDLVKIFETGNLEITPPEVIRVNISGKRFAPICATDILINLALNLSDSSYSGASVEYSGPALAGMPIADRQTLCAIGSLIDVRSALTPCDTVTLRHLAALGNWKFEQIAPDRDAEFKDSYQFNIESVKPMVAIKHARDGAGAVEKEPQLSLDSHAELQTSSANGRPVASPVSHPVSFCSASEATGIEFDVAFLGGAPGGHYESLRKASDALRGKRVADNVRLLVSPISRNVYLRCLKRGILRQFLEAGAVILNPGLDSDALGHLGIHSTARIATASVEPLFSTSLYSVDRYVVSPLTVAVSSVNGHLLDPRGN